MRLRSLAGVPALLGSAALLLTGSGLQGTLLSYRAALEGWGETAIALLMSGYYAGFFVGCFAAPGIVRRVGHIRAFAVFAAIAASAALLHSLLVWPPVWAALRFASGVCFAGLYMVIESWLNATAANADRGRLISIYRIVDIGASTVGQFLLAANDPRTALPFALLTLLICLSLVPVSLTRAVSPAPPPAARLRLATLYRVSPLAVVACFGSGMIGAAFWALTPAFLAAQQHPPAFVATFMAAALLGGAALQWPVGWLTDRFDRRTVLTAVLFLGALGSAGVVAARWADTSVLLAAAFLFGAAMLPIYSVCVAHANDFATAENFVETSSGLLLVNAAGAVIGPIAASLFTAVAGVPYLFGFLAMLHALLGLYALYRMTRRAAVPNDQQEGFVPVPRTTPAVFVLDPRGGEGQPASGPQRAL